MVKKLPLSLPFFVLKVFLLCGITSVVSCSSDDSSTVTLRNLSPNLAIKSTDTLWNRTAIAYPMENSNLITEIELSVDGEFVNSYQPQDSIFLNTKDFTDGTHIINLTVMQGRDYTSVSVETHFLNTLAKINFGESLYGSRKYVLIDFHGEPILYKEIMDNQTLEIERPEDFNETYFNVNYIIQQGAANEILNILSHKNVKFWEDLNDSNPIQGNLYDFEIVNLPSDYTYYNMDGSINSGSGPSEYPGYRLPMDYSQYVSYLNDDFYLYVKEQNRDRYLYIDDVAARGNNAVYDFELASDAMDAYDVNFEFPLSTFIVEMKGASEGYKRVYSSLPENAPFSSLNFSLPRLEDFEKYDDYVIKQLFFRDNKVISIEDSTSEFRIKEPTDLDFTYSNPGLGQMQLDISGDYDRLDYLVTYRKQNFNMFQWRVYYEDYNNHHEFPTIPKEIVPDFDTFIEEYQYDYSTINIHYDYYRTKYRVSNNPGAEDGR